MSSDTAPGPVDICVCTFRRPQLAICLQSLNALEVPANRDVRIIVADNDVAPSARAVVESFAAQAAFEVRYIHCPARNISLARNACLNASDGAYLAFVDDDETVTAAWLCRMLERIEATGADAVLGPVRALYRDDTPEWMREGDFHSTYPVFVRGDIRTGYTCNVLMKQTSRLVSGRKFSIERGQIGGEDTEFFGEMVLEGGAIVYAPDAWIEEVVPADRARFGWLQKRRFRAGQTHGRLLAGRIGPASRAANLSLAVLKIGYCLVAAGLQAIWPQRRNRNWLRATLHLGTLCGLLGMREIRMYGLQAPIAT